MTTTARDDDRADDDRAARARPDHRLGAWGQGADRQALHDPAGQSSRLRGRVRARGRGAPPRLRPERRRRAGRARDDPLQSDRTRPASRPSSRAGASQSQSSRFAPDASGPRDRRRARPAGSRLALLLGRGCRARLLVSRARGALEEPAARAAARRAAAAGRSRAVSALARPARDPRGDLSRPARPHLPDGASRRAVFGAEPLADLHLRDLLARSRACAGRVRERVAGAEPVARDRERRRVDLAEARAGLEAAARVSGAARPLAGRVLPPLLRGSRALLRRAGEPAGAGARDRALQLRDVVRHGRLRAAGMGLARERLHRLLRPARADRTLRRARGPARVADAVLRSVGPRHDVRDCSRSWR